MSLTLTPSTRLVAYAGVLLLTGLAAVVFLLARGALGGGESATTASTPLVRQPVHAPAKTGTTAARPAHKPKPTPPASGLPARVDHALRYNRVVVISVSIPHAAVDSVVRREARSAATATRAGFVSLSALDEHAMTQLLAKAGVLPDPTVLVVRRPGRIVAKFSVTDAATIAQAIAQKRR